MKCNKHDKMVVMHAFSSGNCIKCDEEVTTSHIPCNKVCPECSENYGLCEICGEEMVKTKKKLKLEVLDPTGEVAKTHHFYYEAGEGNRLRLSITDNVYIMDKDGKVTQEEIGRETSNYCHCKDPDRKIGSNFCYKCLSEIHDNKMRFLAQKGEVFNIPAKDDTDEILERVKRKLFPEDQYKEHLSSDNSIKIDNNETKDLREEIPEITLHLKTKTIEGGYFNPKTGKTQTLFEKLIPVWTIGVSTQNIVSGDKGCAVYITVEAEDVEHAKDKAMLNEEFMSHIYDRKNFDRKYLRASEPHGNYVIGKVLYYEGDPRL